MRLHARSVAAAIGTPEGCFAELVDRLVASGEIKSWKAEEILSDLRSERRKGATIKQRTDVETGIGYGKIEKLKAEHGEAVSVMRQIKSALDPDNIMNPGKIL